MENMSRSISVSYGFSDDRNDDVQMNAQINTTGHIAINVFVKSASLFKEHNGEINNKLLEFEKEVVKEIERGAK